MNLIKFTFFNTELLININNIIKMKYYYQINKKELFYLRVNFVK